MLAMSVSRPQLSSLVFATPTTVAAPRIGPATRFAVVAVTSRSSATNVPSAVTDARPGRTPGPMRRTPVAAAQIVLAGARGRGEHGLGATRERDELRAGVAGRIGVAGHDIAVRREAREQRGLR